MWKSVKLKDVTSKIGSGATPKGGREAYYQEGIPLIRSLNVYDDGFREKDLAFLNDEQALKLSGVEVLDGDVLLNITGASIARCCVAPTKYLPARVNQHVSIIRPRMNMLRPDFLSYLLSSKGCKDKLLHIGDKAGATRQALTKSQIEHFEIPLPPLPEQRRIVAILDEAFAGIDAAIANTQANLTAARELFESYLNRVFTEKGEGWVEMTVGDAIKKGILDRPIDGNHGETHPKKSDFVEHGVPFVMASDLQDGRVNQTACNFISREQADGLRKGFARNGDVLLSHKGTIGRAAILETKLDYVMLTPQVTYYRILNLASLSRDFLYFFFQSTLFQAEIGHIAGAGTTRAYIGITRQHSLHIAFPSLELQNIVVEKLSYLEEEAKRLEALYQQKLNALNELKQSILAKAFRGELTNGELAA